MAGKPGKSGRTPKEGYAVSLNLRLNPELVSPETIEFLHAVGKEKDTTQRGIMLAHALITAYFSSNGLTGSGDYYIDLLHYNLICEGVGRNCSDIENYIHAWASGLPMCNIYSVEVIDDDCVNALLSLDGTCWELFVNSNGVGDSFFNAVITEQVIDAPPSTPKQRYSNPRYISKGTRFDVLRKYGYRCAICGHGALDGVKLEIDHIHPVSKGGTNAPTNLQVLCTDCNSGKRAKPL